MKVKKEVVGSFYILGYLLQVSIKIWRSGTFFSKSGEFGPFFPWKIFRLKFGKISQTKKKKNNCLLLTL
jgi:hypothetical protein